MPLIVLFLALPIYFSGNFIGDIYNSYINGINDPFETHYDIGFIWLIETIGRLGVNDNCLMYSIQGVTAIFLTTSFAQWRKERTTVPFTIAFIFMSVYFFLSTQNALRQGLSTAAILWAVYFWSKGQWGRAVFLAIVAQTFHFSAVIFIAVIMFSIVAQSLFKIKKLSYAKQQRVLNFRIILFGILFAIGLIVFIDLTPQSLFVATRNNERFLGFEKIFAILFIFIVTNYLWLKKPIDKLTEKLLFIRVTSFSIFLALSLSPQLAEVASRVLFFYFSIEAICGLRLISNSSWNVQRLGSVFLLAIYGISLNVLTLLEQHIGQ